MFGIDVPLIAGAAGGELLHGAALLGGPPEAVISVRTVCLVSAGLSTTDLACKTAPARACRPGTSARILPAVNKTELCKLSFLLSLY